MFSTGEIAVFCNNAGIIRHIETQSHVPTDKQAGTHTHEHTHTHTHTYARAHACCARLVTDLRDMR